MAPPRMEVQVHASRLFSLTLGALTLASTATPPAPAPTPVAPREDR